MSVVPGRRSAKDALFDGFAEIGRALGSGRRAEIVEILAQGERTVEEIAGAIEQSVANTSHHLQVLARTGLVVPRRHGRHVSYRLGSQEVGEMWAALRDVAANHLDEIDALAVDYLGDRSTITTITRDEFERRHRLDEVVVIDVRPRVEFEAGHIPGAISVPPERMDEALSDLQAEGQVVAYCRGPYCVYADQAVRILRERGVDAMRLEDGYPEWRRAGGAAGQGDT